MQLVSRLRKLNQRGDTLVEVLISIAIISLVLGGAYVTTNRSLWASRDAQERSIALKLTEAELEQLKNLANSGSDIFGASTAGTFCVYNGSVLDATTSTDCTVDTNGNGSPAAGVQPKFKLTAKRAVNTFTLTTTWINARGSGSNNLTVNYRLYPQ